MNISSTLARLLYHRHLGGKFPAWFSWKLLTHLETIPDGENVYTFTVGDRLYALVGKRAAKAERRAA